MEKEDIIKGLTNQLEILDNLSEVVSPEHTMELTVAKLYALTIIYYLGGDDIELDFEEVIE